MEELTKAFAKDIIIAAMLITGIITLKIYAKIGAAIIIAALIIITIKLT